MKNKHKFLFVTLAFLATGGGGFALADDLGDMPASSVSNANNTSTSASSTATPTSSVNSSAPSNASSEVTTFQLEPTVISATGYEQEVKYAPASISIIPKEEIVNKPIRDLGDIVQEVPGVSTSVAKTGASSISIRGMSSDYTLILVDGKRINTSKGFDGQGFDSTTTAIPPASMIERVEVIRGPASTIYGSDAMGGVINIITKKSADKVSASVSFETRLQENHATWGNAQGVNGNIFLPLGERFSLNLRGKYNYAEKNKFFWSEIPGYTSTSTNPYTSHSPTGYTDAGAGMRLNFTANEQNSFYFDADFGFIKLGSLNTSRFSITNVRDYFKYNFILNHDGDYSFGRFNSFVQYSEISRMPEITPGWDASNGAQAGGFTGIQPPREDGKRDHSALIYNPSFTYQTTFNTNFDFGNAGALVLNAGPYFFHERLYKRGDSFDKSAYQAAAFVEGEYFIGDLASITAGVRGNGVQTYGFFAAPRAYVNVFFTDWLTFKAGVASGLQVPELSTRYDGLYDRQTNAQGVNTDYYGNTNLEVEKNLNYEAGFMVSNAYLSAALSGYFTDFSDKISSNTYQDNEQIPGYGLCQAGQGGTCSMPINVDKAILYGAEFSLKTGRGFRELTGGFGFDTSFAYTDTEQRSGVNKGKPLSNVPMYNASAKISFDKGSWGSYVRYIGKYKTPTFGVHTANVGPGEYFKDTHIVDLGLNYKANDKLVLSFVVNNLLDFDTIDYFTYTSNGRLSYSNSYQRMIPGRNYWLNIRADFQPKRL